MNKFLPLFILPVLLASPAATAARLSADRITSAVDLHMQRTDAGTGEVTATPDSLRESLTVTAGTTGEGEVKSRGQFPIQLRTDIEDYSELTVTGSDCLYLAAPTAKAGQMDTLAQRKQNYFVLTVRGRGQLTFDCRTSIDSYYDAKFIVYLLRNGNTTPDLYGDDLLYESTGAWEKRVYDKEMGDYYGGLSADSWWADQAGLISFDDTAYTRQIVFSAVGPTAKDSNGETIKLDEYDTESRNNERIENRVYLDNFLWEALDDADSVVKFDLDSTLVNQRAQTLTLSSEYAPGVFEFYYTLDGSRPTLSSARYDSRSGILLNRSCKVTVGACEVATGQFVKFISADFTFAIPVPEATVSDGLAFSDSTNLTFRGDYTDSVDYYYTLDGSTPAVSSSPKVNGGVLPLDNKEIEGRTLKVVAATDLLVSDVLTIQFTRMETPSLTFTVDGVESTATVFRDSVSWQAAADLRVEPAAAPLTESGRVRCYRPGSNGRISSRIVEHSFTKADQSRRFTTADVFRGGTGGWVLYAVPYQITREDGCRLAEWLKPCEYSPATGVVSRSSCMENGRAYWVHPAYVDGGASIIIHHTGQAPEPAADGLVSGNADYLWTGDRFIPAGSGDSAKPGFKQK